MKSWLHFDAFRFLFHFFLFLIAVLLHIILVLVVACDSTLSPDFLLSLPLLLFVAETWGPLRGNRHLGGNTFETTLVQKGTRSKTDHLVRHLFSSMVAPALPRLYCGPHPSLDGGVFFCMRVCAVPALLCSVVACSVCAKMLCELSGTDVVNGQVQPCFVSCRTSWRPFSSAC